MNFSEDPCLQSKGHHMKDHEILKLRIEPGQAMFHVVHLAQVFCDCFLLTLSVALPLFAGTAIVALLRKVG